MAFGGWLDDVGSDGEDRVGSPLASFTTAGSLTHYYSRWRGERERNVVLTSELLGRRELGWMMAGEGEEVPYSLYSLLSLKPNFGRFSEAHLTLFFGVIWGGK